jgi:hypothetical protein
LPYVEHVLPIAYLCVQNSIEFCGGLEWCEWRSLAKFCPDQNVSPKTLESGFLVFLTSNEVSFLLNVSVRLLLFNDLTQMWTFRASEDSRVLRRCGRMSVVGVRKILCNIVLVFTWSPPVLLLRYCYESPCIADEGYLILM